MNTEKYENIGYNEKIPLLSLLKNYSEMDISCFDVPGHVRSQGVSILNDYLGNEIMNMDINSSYSLSIKKRLTQESIKLASSLMYSCALNVRKPFK